MISYIEKQLYRHDLDCVQPSHQNNICQPMRYAKLTVDNIINYERSLSCHNKSYIIMVFNDHRSNNNSDVPLRIQQ